MSFCKSDNPIVIMSKCFISDFEWWLIFESVSSTTYFAHFFQFAKSLHVAETMYHSHASLLSLWAMNRYLQAINQQGSESFSVTKHAMKHFSYETSYRISKSRMWFLKKSSRNKLKISTTYVEIQKVDPPKRWPIFTESSEAEYRERRITSFEHVRESNDIREHWP